MRRIVTLAATVAALVSGLVTLVSSPAYARPRPRPQYDPDTGICLIWIEGPWKPRQPRRRRAEGHRFGRSLLRGRQRSGRDDPPPGPVACNSEYGYWSNGYHCYITLLTRSQVR